MKTQLPISIEIDGTKVTGYISFRSESDIEVSYYSSGGLKKIWRHIPYFERPFHSFQTDYGIKRAKELLTNLYDDNR